jgi:hypothetical protein
MELTLADIAPDGYSVHFTRSDPEQNSSPDAERDRLGPDQLTRSRYMRG